MPFIRSWSPSSSDKPKKSGSDSDSSSSSSHASTIEKAEYEALNIARNELGPVSDSASTRSYSVSSKGSDMRRRRNAARDSPIDPPSENESSASKSESDSDSDADDESETSRRKVQASKRAFSMHDGLEEAMFVEKLTVRIISIAQCVYNLTSSSTLAVILSTSPDGIPVAQLVVRDGPRTLVLMEERGLLPWKMKGVQRREWFAVHVLLKQIEAFWGVLCKKDRGKLGGPYYVSGLTVKGDGKVV